MPAGGCTRPTCSGPPRPRSGWLPEASRPFSLMVEGRAVGLPPIVPARSGVACGRSHRHSETSMGRCG
jgi:hypothetical protein